jgi:uncharacterized RDD family membrane protein YckC
LTGDAPAPAANAGLARRAGSLAYEAVLLTAFLFICTWVFLFIGQALDAALARHLLQAWLLLLSGAYFVYCWTHGGQTLPMKTWHIRLVTATGGALPVRLAVKRYLLALVSLGACGLGFAWALVDRDHQFLHDRLAGTRLILRALTDARRPRNPGPR